MQRTTEKDYELIRKRPPGVLEPRLFFAAVVAGAGVRSEAAARQSGEGPRFVHQPTPLYLEVARSSGHDVLDTVAQAAAKTWKHVLAPQEDAPVTRWAEINLTFKLDA